MSLTRIEGVRIAGVATCVPPGIAENADRADQFGAAEVRKVVAMAGIRQRRIAAPDVTSVDLCVEAAQALLGRLGWDPSTVTGLVFVTQTPDYFLPSSSCVIHRRLALPDSCAAFDVGLGCSGYPYGLYLAATMLRAGGHRRLLVLHGETPSKFVDPDDQATALLFGDAGSATALESAEGAPPLVFALHTDGTGAEQLIVRGGGFRERFPGDGRRLCLEMDGAAIFNFTVKRVPALIEETLGFAGLAADAVDSFVFHQSNQFIMLHIAKKCGLPAERVPLILDRFGNGGGPSVPLALTQSFAKTLESRPAARSREPVRVMMLGYGVGLSWGAVLADLDADIAILHADHGAGATAGCSREMP